MARFSFENLTVYRKSLQLAKRMKEIKKEDSLIKERIFSLPQTIACAESYSNHEERIKFLREARGICYRTIPLIDLAQHECGLSESLQEDLLEEIESLSRMLSNLIFSLCNESTGKKS